MRTHTFPVRCQWCLWVLAWTAAAAALGVVAGGLVGLLVGGLLGFLRDNLDLVGLLAGRGAMAGVATGAILGMLAKIIAGVPEEEEPNPADGLDQRNHSPGTSANGLSGMSGPYGAEPRIRSRR